jgi:hypothetical protein
LHRNYTVTKIKDRFSIGFLHHINDEKEMSDSTNLSFGVRELALGAATTLAIVQLVTPMDPIGKCWTLLRQLSRHVSG